MISINMPRGGKASNIKGAREFTQLVVEAEGQLFRARH